VFELVPHTLSASGSWLVRAVLEPAIPVGASQRFGQAMVVVPRVSGNPRLAVAAPGDGDRGRAGSGSVYLYVPQVAVCGCGCGCGCVWLL